MSLSKYKVKVEEYNTSIYHFYGLRTCASVIYNAKENYIIWSTESTFTLPEFKAKIERSKDRQGFDYEKYMAVYEYIENLPKRSLANER